jgi:hypothetical protein
VVGVGLSRWGARFLKQELVVVEFKVDRYPRDRTEGVGGMTQNEIGNEWTPRIESHEVKLSRSKSPHAVSPVASLYHASWSLLANRRPHLRMFLEERLSCMSEAKW